MQWKTFAALLALMGASTGASAASSIAYDNDGAFGYSMNQPSVSDATQRALQYCSRYSRNCGLVAYTPGPGYSAIFTGTAAVGFALGEDTPQAAQRKAERMCKARTNDCTLALLWQENPPRASQGPSQPYPQGAPHLPPPPPKTPPAPPAPPAPKSGMPVPERSPGQGAPLEGPG